MNKRLYIKLTLPPTEEEIEICQALIDSKTHIRRTPILIQAKHLFTTHKRKLK